MESMTGASHGYIRTKATRSENVGGGFLNVKIFWIQGLLITHV